MQPPQVVPSGRRRQGPGPCHLEGPRHRYQDLAILKDNLEDNLEDKENDAGEAGHSPSGATLSLTVRDVASLILPTTSQEAGRTRIVSNAAPAIAGRRDN
jgi:hypothetical protein